MFKLHNNHYNVKKKIFLTDLEIVTPDSNIADKIKSILNTGVILSLESCQLTIRIRNQMGLWLCDNVPLETLLTNNQNQNPTTLI